MMRMTLITTRSMQWNKSTDQPLKAIKPRPEAAPVCGQNVSKRPTGPHLRVDIRHIAVPTRSNVAPLVLRGGFIGQKNPTAVRSEDVFDAGHTCGPTAMKAKKMPHMEGYKSPKSSKEQHFNI